MKFISNKTLFNIHSWLGLNLGLFLFVVCFSGTFATLSNEVDWLLDEDMRIPQKDDAPVAWEAMHQELRAAYPAGSIDGLYKHTYAGVSDYFTTVAYLSLPNGQTLKVYLNPYTGQIQGDSSFFNVQRFFRSYHRRFFDGDRGIVLVTLSSFFLLFSSLSGFLFYKGWLKNLFRLRLREGAKKLWSDAHKLLGIWSLVFAFLIALTGVFYFAELITIASGKYEVLVPEEPEPLSTQQLGSHASLLPVDTYAERAQQAFPELDIMTVRLPDNPQDLVYIDGQAGNPLLRNRANKVYLDPVTAEVVQVQKSSDLNPVEFVTDLADPLHFGYFGGLIAKIIWFIFGLAISFSILIGTYLWYIRGLDKLQKKQKRSAEKPLAPAWHPAFWKQLLTISGGAPAFTLLTLLYLMYTGIGVVMEGGIRAYGPHHPEYTQALAELQPGPWQAELRCTHPCTAENGTFGLHFSDEDLPNYRSASLLVRSANGQETELPFKGNGRNVRYQKDRFMPDQQQPDLAAANAIQVQVRSYDGKVHNAAVSPERIRQAQQRQQAAEQDPGQRAMPEVPAGVYAFILFFGLCTAVVAIAWMRFIFRYSLKAVRIIPG